MYVKWVIRRHKNEELANINFYDAYLVQSYKNESGEPRQRTICYLGNLRQIDNQFPVIERALFYTRMEEALQRHLPKELQGVEERVKLYQCLSIVAPPPTPEEIQQGVEMHQRWHDQYWKAVREAADCIALEPPAFVTVQEQEMASAEVNPGEPFKTEGPLDHITLIGWLNTKSKNP